MEDASCANFKNRGSPEGIVDWSSDPANWIYFDMICFEGYEFPVNSSYYPHCLAHPV